VRQIENRKEMSNNAQIAETQMLAKRRKKGMLKNAWSAQPLTIVVRVDAVDSSYMATRDRIVSTAAVVGVRTPSLCSF
jgi:hypothetical protein